MIIGYVLITVTYKHLWYLSTPNPIRILIYPHNSLTFKSHPWPCPPSIWNCIHTGPPINTISLHKHPLNLLKIPLPPPCGSPLHTISPSDNCQLPPHFYSTADERHCDGWKLLIFFHFQAFWCTVAVSRAFSDGCRIFTPIYPFISLFHLPSIPFIITNDILRKPWKDKMIKKNLNRRKESDNYLTNIYRHHWSRKNPMKIDEVGAFSQHSGFHQLYEKLTKVTVLTESSYYINFHRVLSALVMSTDTIY